MQNLWLMLYRNTASATEPEKDADYNNFISSR